MYEELNNPKLEIKPLHEEIKEDVPSPINSKV